MADGSLKIIRNKNIYTIDLTDAEDNVFHTLTFHLGDANFPIKILELYDDAFREMNKLEEQEEQIKKEIEYSAMTEARKEVISLLGGALAGVKNSQPVMVASPQEDMEEQPEDDVMNDADVAGLAMGWMSKGD